jgi:type I restriction enzyme M protein
MTLLKPATSDIVAKLWNLCNVLRDDGVTYHQYVSELTYLLFLKMMQETSQESRLIVHVPAKDDQPAHDKTGTTWGI